jgi:hypothetical protein
MASASVIDEVLLLDDIEKGYGGTDENLGR